MSRITKYIDFQNESVRDLMTPKSEEDIKQNLKRLSPAEKLRLGCSKNIIWLVEEALKEGAKVHALEQHIIRNLIANEYVDIIKVLLDKDAKNIANDILELASDYNNKKIIELALSYDADINTGNGHPLRSVSRRGDTYLINYLLNRGADIHTWNDSALLSSIWLGDLNVVKLLLRRGANPNADNGRIMSEAKRMAEERKGEENFTEIYSLLKKHNRRTMLNKYIGISTNKYLNESLKDMMTPKTMDELKNTTKDFSPSKKLNYGINHGIAELVKMAIQEGIDVNEKDSYGRSPLIDVISKSFTSGDDIEIIKILLDSGADINFKEPTGMTPLMFAAFKGDWDMVELLLNNGADASIKDKNNNTAIDYAEIGGHPSIKYLIRELGKVDESVRDKMTPKSDDDLMELFDGMSIPEKEIKNIINKIRSNKKMNDNIEFLLKQLIEVKKSSSFRKLVLIYQQDNLMKIFKKQYLDDLVEETITDEKNRIDDLTDDIILLRDTKNDYTILVNINTYNYMVAGSSGLEYIKKAIDILFTDEINRDKMTPVKSSDILDTL